MAADFPCTESTHTFLAVSKPRDDHTDDDDDKKRADDDNDNDVDDDHDEHFPHPRIECSLFIFI